MEERLINDIKPHPQNDRIYGDSYDDDFLESIKKYGMDTPVKITPDGVIISGHRRWSACKALKHDTIPVQEIDETDPDKLVELLITNNVQREKTNDMKAREFKVLKQIEEQRAAARRQASQNNNTAKAVVENLPPQVTTGKSRDIAAQKIGWSGRTAEQAEKVIDHIDEIKESEPEKAEHLTQELNKSVSGAANKIRPQKKSKEQKKEANPLKVKTKEMEAAFEVLIKQVAKAKKDNWKTISKETITQYINSLKSLIDESI